MKYAVLPRGINVGGNSLIKMAELRTCLENVGFTNVKTYIQSGNIIVESIEADKSGVAYLIEQTIHKEFGHTVPAVVLTRSELQAIVENVPSDWGKHADWKYNYLFLIPPYNMKEVIDSIGPLKPEIESMKPGNGVLYQSVSYKMFGRATTGKLASMPIYKKMTIRNHRTVPKLVAMMNEN